jgi:hypothetical protein
MKKLTVTVTLALICTTAAFAQQDANFYFDRGNKYFLR